MSIIWLINREAEYRAMLRKARFKRRWPEVTKVKIKTEPWFPPGPPQRMPRIVSGSYQRMPQHITVRYRENRYFYCKGLIVPKGIIMELIQDDSIYVWGRLEHYHLHAWKPTTKFLETHATPNTIYTWPVWSVAKALPFWRETQAQLWRRWSYVAGCL